MAILSKTKITIDLRTLDHLDLAYSDVLERVDVPAFLGDFLGNKIGVEVVKELIDVSLGDFFLKNFLDLATDVLDLTAFGVAGLTDLKGKSSGECNYEDSEDVSIKGLGVNMSFDKGLPLTDHVAELIASDIKPIETGLAVTTFDLIDDESDLTPSELV